MFAINHRHGYQTNINDTARFILLVLISTVDLSKHNFLNCTSRNKQPLIQDSSFDGHFFFLRKKETQISRTILYTQIEQKCVGITSRESGGKRLTTTDFVTGNKRTIDGISVTISTFDCRKIVQCQQICILKYLIKHGDKVDTCSLCISSLFIQSLFH